MQCKTYTCKYICMYLCIYIICILLISSLGFESSDFTWPIFLVLFATLKTRSSYLQKWNLLLSCNPMILVAGDFKKQLKYRVMHSGWHCCSKYRSVTIFLLMHQHTFPSTCHSLSLKLWIPGTAELLFCNGGVTLDLKSCQSYFPTRQTRSDGKAAGVSFVSDRPLCQHWRKYFPNDTCQRVSTVPSQGKQRSLEEKTLSHSLFLLLFCFNKRKGCIFHQLSLKIPWQTTDRSLCLLALMWPTQRIQTSDETDAKDGKTLQCKQRLLWDDDSSTTWLLQTKGRSENRMALSLTHLDSKVRQFIES